MKRAHDSEMKMLERHLGQAHADCKTYEMVVRQLTSQLEQERRRNMCVGWGKEGTDFPDGVEFESTSTRHSHYTVKGLVREEELTATIKYSMRYMECGHQGDIEAVEQRENSSGSGTIEEEVTQRQVVVRRLCKQISQCLEERELRYVEQARSELAAHHVNYLQYNSQLTETMSRSLESLTSVGTVAGDCQGVVEDLKSLQSHLEKWRLARHLSWP